MYGLVFTPPPLPYKRGLPQTPNPNYTVLFYNARGHTAAGSNCMMLYDIFLDSTFLICFNLVFIRFNRLFFRHKEVLYRGLSVQNLQV